MLGTRRLPDEEPNHFASWEAARGVLGGSMNRRTSMHDPTAPGHEETDAGSLLELEDAFLHEVTGGQADVDSEPDGNGVEQGGFGTA